MCFWKTKIFRNILIYSNLVIKTISCVKRKKSNFHFPISIHIGKKILLIFWYILDICISNLIFFTWDFFLNLNLTCFQLFRFVSKSFLWKQLHDSSQENLGCGIRIDIIVSLSVLSSPIQLIFTKKIQILTQLNIEYSFRYII